MNKTLIFLCISCCIVIFTIIVICTGPVLSGILTVSGSENCKIYADLYDYSDDKDHVPDDDKRKKYLDYFKKGKNLCNRNKAIYGLEYSTVIIDIVLAFICSLFALLHFFDIGKSFEKFTGIIGLASGIIGFIITLIYIIYSGYIFTNDRPGKNYVTSFNSVSSNFSPYGTDKIIKVDKDRAFAKWDGSKYECFYYKKDDEDSFYATYSDLGKKQYNYNKDNYFDNDENSKYIRCAIGVAECENHFYNNDAIRPTYGDNNDKCEYLYYNSNSNKDGIEFKYGYDKWVTSIIFGCFIIALNLGLAIFGFLLFKDSGSSSGHTPV